MPVNFFGAVDVNGWTVGMDGRSYVKVDQAVRGYDDAVQVCNNTNSSSALPAPYPSDLSHTVLMGLLEPGEVAYLSYKFWSANNSFVSPGRGTFW